MKKIATPTAVDGEFVDGNRETGRKATQFSAEWCNDIQNEIWNLIRGLKGSDPTGESQDEALKAVNRHVVEYLTQENLTSAKIFEVLEAGKLPVLQIGGGGTSGYTKMYAYPVSFYKVTEGNDAGYRRAVFFRYSRDVDNDAESNKLYWYKYVNIPVAGQGESYTNGTVDLEVNIPAAIEDYVKTNTVASKNSNEIQGSKNHYQLKQDILELVSSFTNQGGEHPFGFKVSKYENGDEHRYEAELDGCVKLNNGWLEIDGNSYKVELTETGLTFKDVQGNVVAKISSAGSKFVGNSGVKGISVDNGATINGGLDVTGESNINGIPFATHQGSSTVWIGDENHRPSVDANKLKSLQCVEAPNLQKFSDWTDMGNGFSPENFFLASNWNYAGQEKVVYYAPATPTGETNSSYFPAKSGDAAVTDSFAVKAGNFRKFIWTGEQAKYTPGGGSEIMVAICLISS